MLRRTLLLLAFSGEVSAIDDEYRYAGAADPKVVLTTSREPSTKLKIFLKVIFFACYFKSLCGFESPEFLVNCDGKSVQENLFVFILLN